MTLVNQLQEEAGKEPLSEPLMTKNGIHYVTRPFNLEKFHKQYPMVEVHKDRYTILYTN